MTSQADHAEQYPVYAPAMCIKSEKRTVLKKSYVFTAWKFKKIS